MHIWIDVLSCILDDAVDLFRVNLFLLFELVLGFVVFSVVGVLFIIIFIVFNIIMIHSCNPIGIVVDESVSVFEREALEALLVSHVFDSFYDDIGPHWYLVNDIPCDH
jgi:hypothetical protein